ncbi:MAG: hypothetical protein DRG11_00960 [Epsilonproteobacteria bacterium]|nr:MAG: hypothetical protein DRG11_00960 [Campylobacterota bacterium]
MLKVILFTLLCGFGSAELLTNSEDKFISKKEYGQMLYKNPRGIGCNLCHGKDGKGKIIAKYKHKNKTKTLITTNIRNMNYKKFTKAINKKEDVKSIMPEYFLTDEEIISIYYFLNHK